jgi:hypothetical protein
MESSLKTLQILRMAMLASIVIYAVVAERFAPPSHPVESVFLPAITILAFCTAASIFPLRRMTIGRSEQILATKPDDAAALGRWRTGHIATFALCEAIALYGVVLRFVGVTAHRTYPFYATGFILTLFFAPRRPSS